MSRGGSTDWEVVKKSIGECPKKVIFADLSVGCGIVDCEGDATCNVSISLGPKHDLVLGLCRKHMIMAQTISRSHGKGWEWSHRRIDI